MKKPLLYIRNTFLFLLIGLILYLNIKLHCGPDFENREKTRKDVLQQLHFLEDELRNENLGVDMQNLFPEGFVFANAIYGLTWAEVAKKEMDTLIFNHALNEARFAYTEINSDFARSNFNSGLVPELGIFYNGWKNYLLAKILTSQKNKDSLEVREFNLNCDKIAAAIDNNNSPYPESYKNASWPADACVAIASLKLHDEMFEAKYTSTINAWLHKVKSSVDSETKLIPHATDPETGKALEGTKGSSICLMLIFMADIDPEFAMAQFQIFNEKFPTTRFGLPVIREYPIGVKGHGDVDSGPVVWDVGFTATIVSVGAFKKFGEYEVANKISASIESIGSPITRRGEKKYLFGKLPMADAFIAWTRVQEPGKVMPHNKVDLSFNPGSTISFHLYSAVIIIILLLFSFRKGSFCF